MTCVSLYNTLNVQIIIILYTTTNGNCDICCETTIKNSNPQPWFCLEISRLLSSRRSAVTALSPPKSPQTSPQIQSASSWPSAFPTSPAPSFHTPAVGSPSDFPSSPYPSPPRPFNLYYFQPSSEIILQGDWLKCQACSQSWIRPIYQIVPFWPFHLQHMLCMG